MMTPIETLSQVEAAKTLKTLIPSGVDREPALKRLKLLLHPDRFARDADLSRRAAEAIYKLDSLLAAEKVAAVVIGDWIVTAPFEKGDIADLHSVVSKHGEPGIMKICRSVRDNDLMETERKAIGILKPGVDTVPFQRYIPALLGSVTASGRKANIMQEAPGFISLADIMAIGSLDFRHVVWMMNRALSVLGYAHGLGVVHGAINPDHLLYNPGTHDLCLVDWCYASMAGAKIPAVVNRYRDNYPPEVLRKESPGGWTDLFMLAHTLSVAASMPRRFRNLFELCMIASPRSRMQSAWGFQDKFRVAAEAEYGEPKFVPLVFPVH